MQKEILIRKVKTKLAEKEIEAGTKDWIAGVALSLTTLLSGIGEAGATSTDVIRHINKLTKQVERDAKLKDHVKIISNPSNLHNYKFKVEVGPYSLEGKFSKDFKSIDLDIKEDSKASEQDIEKWKPFIEKMKKDVEKEINIDREESLDNIRYLKNLKEQVENKIYKYLESEGVAQGNLYRSELAEYYSRNYDEFKKDYPESSEIEGHKEVQDYADSQLLKKNTDEFFKKHTR